jgi:Zn-dependent protease
MDRFNLTSILLNLPTLFIALTVHEFSHALVSDRLGDPTPRSLGRLSLNPLRHLDPVGAIFLLLFRFGWAKPVPINPSYYKKVKSGTSLVSVAGPVSNLILAFIGLFILRFSVEFLYQNQIYILIFLIQFIMVNITLAVFNLLPFSPLDGSKIYISLLPDRIYFKILQYERYGFIAIMLLLVTGLLDRPIGFLSRAVLSGFGSVAFAGNPELWSAVYGLLY